MEKVKEILTKVREFLKPVLPYLEVALRFILCHILPIDCYFKNKKIQHKILNFREEDTSQRECETHIFLELATLNEKLKDESSHLRILDEKGRFNLGIVVFTLSMLFLSIPLTAQENIQSLTEEPAVRFFFVFLFVIVLLFLTLSLLLSVSLLFITQYYEMTMEEEANAKSKVDDVTYSHYAINYLVYRSIKLNSLLREQKVNFLHSTYRSLRNGIISLILVTLILLLKVWGVI